MKKSLYLNHFELTKPNIQQKDLSSLSNCISIGNFIQVGFFLGEKKRIQFFKGIIIAINGKKITLRRPGTGMLRSSHGVEFVFSRDQINTWKILQSQNFGKQFRRSKLFFLRKRKGKSAFGNMKYRSCISGEIC